jgi:hypothetical protein
MKREELIEKLVDFEVDRFFQRSDMADYVSYIFRNGVLGYEKYTDEELLGECLDYGLIDEEDL